MEIMDADTSVLRVYYEKVSVPYWKNGVQKNTIVDFLLETVGGKVLLEVKNSYSVSVQKEKLAAIEMFARKNGVPFIIWTEKELFP